MRKRFTILFIWAGLSSSQFQVFAQREDSSARDSVTINNRAIALSQDTSFSIKEIHYINDAIIKIIYNLDVPTHYYGGKRRRGRYHIKSFYSDNNGFSYVPMDSIFSIRQKNFIIPNTLNDTIMWFPEFPPGEDLASYQYLLTAEYDYQSELDWYLERGGPKNALSSIIPGLGNQKFKPRKKYWWLGITTGTLSLLGAGYWTLKSANNLYQDQYRNASDPASAHNLYEKYLNRKKTARWLLGAGLLVWTVDILQVAIRGFINKNRIKKLQKKRNLAKKRTSLFN